MRKNIGRLIFGAAFLWVGAFGYSASSAFAAYPDRVVRIIAPYPPGGFTDVVTRQVAARLTMSLGQSVVVENKPGAGTNIGTESVVRAAPDGYTLLMGTSSLAINPSLYAKLNYDPVKDLVPLGIFATTGYTLLANNELPVSNTAELVEYARARPDAVSFGSSGNGAVNHLAGVQFGTMAGIKMQHIPYRGSQAAITDLIGGRIQLFWASTLEALPMVKAGRVKALGVTDQARVPVLVGVPPLGDAVRGYAVQYWMGLFAPAGTPAPVVQRLADALREATSSPEMQKLLQESGAAAVYYDPAQARDLLDRDIVSWGKTVRESGAQVE
jgi:tripartite-type tricarboxylate transporter receptor subunit TctC